MGRDEIISNLELMNAEVEWEYPIDYAATIDEAIKLIQERKVGHWVRYGNNMCFCSECNQNYDEPRSDEKFCGNCGAMMEN